MIRNLFDSKRPVFSLEVFPPKRTDDIAIVYETLNQLKNLNPDYISVTYGAGGSTSKATVSIASYIMNACGIEALAHLTCAALTEEDLNHFMNDLKVQKIHNVLALRGDKPKNMTEADFEARRYRYASDLVTIIRSLHEVSIAAACYPENRTDLDMAHLKIKVDAGCDFLITQLFFDNQHFYRFLERLDEYDIHIPVMAGLMPITTVSQIDTMIKLSGASIPKSLSIIIDKYKDSPEDFKRAGLDFATNQAMDLLEHNADGIHLYTMNKVDVSQTIFRNLGLL